MATSTNTARFNVTAEDCLGFAGNFETNDPQAMTAKVRAWSGNGWWVDINGSDAVVDLNGRVSW